MHETTLNESSLFIGKFEEILPELRMKNILLIVLLLLPGFGVHAQEEKVIPEGPFITFEETSHDFGDIHQDDKVEHIFVFENTGTAPLIITNVQTTCGCTAPEWPREPIMPGQTASIKVIFNSKGKFGRQNKVISVISNAVSPVNQVKIVTNVLPKESE